ncbi:MAG: hypothetical protein ACRDIY_18080 [Chloroflexota bacterium]
MATERERRALAAIVVEARHLAEDQRRALRHADFPDLLAIAGTFHRLTLRLADLPPDVTSIGSTADLLALRDQIARQNHLLGLTVAATTPPRRAYGPGSAPRASASLLLDQYT